jgi:hypothetical protein
MLGGLVDEVCQVTFQVLRTVTADAIVDHGVVGVKDLGAVEDDDILRSPQLLENRPQ